MKGSRILVFIASVLALLFIAGVVFPEEGITLAGKQFFLPSFRSIVQEQEEEAGEKSLLTASKRQQDLSLLQDTANYYRFLIDSSDMRFWLPSIDYLDTFWARAERAQAEGRTLRILHYGDSQIEMDHITSRLRSYMQHRFGGGGPGMLPVHRITPITAASVSSSEGLIHLASFGDSTVHRSKGNYGPMMQCFRLSGSASANVKAYNNKVNDELVKHYTDISLIYNNLGNRLEVTLNDRKNGFKERQQAEKGVGRLQWHLDTTSSFRLHLSGHADLYALLVDNGAGVAVDNIPMRGCSGQQFTLVPETLLSAAYNQMDVGLIILQFGGNMVPYLRNEKAVSTYCESMARQITHLRQCCPEAQIVFIGPSDMSKRIKGHLQTYPIIPSLVDSLSTTVVQQGCAFWSIFHAMGGLNSMPAWSRQGLAGSDYIHFSQRGADLMGDRLAEAFDNSYQDYLVRQRLRKAKGGAR